MVLAAVVDVSDRRDLALAFQGLFDASPYGLMLVDDTGVIVQSNAALSAALAQLGDTSRVRITQGEPGLRAEVLTPNGVVSL